MRIGTNQLDALAREYAQDIVLQGVDWFLPSLSDERRERCRKDALQALGPELANDEIGDAQIIRLTYRFMVHWVAKNAPAETVRPPPLAGMNRG